MKAKGSNGKGFMKEKELELAFEPGSGLNRGEEEDGWMLL